MQYLVENNKEYPKDTVFNYIGCRITYSELFENIDRVAASFIKAGVKEKEISDEIIELCKNNLPEYMVPIEVELVDDMLRTPAGKIDYRALEKHNS